MWENVAKSNADSAYYTVMRKSKEVDGMAALRSLFPDGMADEMNMVLFSTSGVHGSYTTIEDAEAALNGSVPEDEQCAEVTFLVLHPRMVSLRYGVCRPSTQEDIDYLRRLRASSHEKLALVGMPWKA